MHVDVEHEGWRLALCEDGDTAEAADGQRGGPWVAAANHSSSAVPGWLVKPGACVEHRADALTGDHGLLLM